MLAAFEESVRVLRDLGARFRDVKLSSLDVHASAKKVIATAELFSVHSRDLRDRPHLLGNSLRYLISTGALITAQDYIAASRWRLELARAMRDAMEEVDLLVLPTMAASAPRLEPMRRDAFYSGERSYTTPFNVSGFPALSLCNGFTAEGMPLSLQIAGRPFDEATVLRAAAGYERATPWRERRPVLAAEPRA
jgi:aspartyl-tRNA(Asn)/glutamyl-tRNA(Gln) amidotransferase subunit A